MSNIVFGIDLGTTTSAISYVNDLNIAETIDNMEGRPITPSVVYFEDAETFVVGEQAKSGAAVYPDQTVSLIKREMGLSGPSVVREFFGTAYTPEMISALILKDLVTNARDMLGTDSNRAVITVPAYFGLTEKQATKTAGEIAGLDVIDIIAEPVAAAISEGFDFTKDETAFIYDLGGGTFDCTVIEYTAAGGLRVIAVDGDRRLGGADWDEALYHLVLGKFTEVAGLDEDPEDDPVFVQDLRNSVETAKQSLTLKNKVKVKCAYGSRIEMIEVTLEEFDACTRFLLDKTLDVVDRTLELASTNEPGHHIDKYLLVGGSSRMKQVESALSARYGWTLEKTHFDRAVSNGAALVAQGMVNLPPIGVTGGGPASDNAGPEVNQVVQPGATDDRTMSITNLLSKAVGVRLIDPESNTPYISHLLHQNEVLPAEHTTTVKTLSDGAVQVSIRLYEQAGEAPSPEVEANREITPDSGAVFTDLPNLPAGSPLTITMRVDASGLLHFSGHEPSTDQTLNLSVGVATMQQEEVAAAKEVIEGLTAAD
ncbi:Hsp70 family protein [Corynebacterium variabile]|uniref:Hsp70 family protein n=1 Tax=Corynebacterium variabile TaxID=1727 RepID=UPI003A8D150D